METIKRNWSSIDDYQGGNFGLRSFYTREEWVLQVAEWHYLDPVFDDIEWHVFKEMLDGMDDEELMHYIQENWQIEIRETTWLKVGNKCYWRDPEGETGGIYEIRQIRRFDEPLDRDTIILLSDGVGETEAPLHECYGLTELVCPRCGEPLCVSDLCSYPYACVKCDENFYYEEVQDRTYVYERCPECEMEVRLDAELKVQKCPKCGKYIVACAMCPNPVELCNGECPLEALCNELNKRDEEV